MIHAELKNKLPREILDREDFLTSSVFGLLKYTHLRPVLKSYLSKAGLVSDTDSTFANTTAMQELFNHPFELIFWERDAEYGEPDILIVGKNAVLAIEVKLRAEISGESQLRRYFDLIRRRYPTKQHHHVLYITTDLSYPQLKETTTRGLEKNLWWVSWYELATILSKHLDENCPQAEICKDLLAILKKRQLTYFMGFTTATFVAADGKKILELVRGMQQLNIEVATLIKSFDKIMAGHDYKTDSLSSVIRDRSDSLSAPQYWTPPYMYRLVKSGKNADDIFNLNIVLDNVDAPEQILEPLLLCARFQYEKGTAKKHMDPWDAWELWFSRPVKELNHFYTTEELGLHSEEFQEDADWKGSVDHMKEVNFIAVPLASMNTTKDLEKLINRFLMK